MVATSLYALDATLEADKEKRIPELDAKAKRVRSFVCYPEEKSEGVSSSLFSYSSMDLCQSAKDSHV